MQQPSAADQPAFRAVDGSELLAVLIDHIDKALYETLLQQDSRFSEGRSYPVASVHCLVRIGLYHDPRQSQPYKQSDIPVRLWTFIQPTDEAAKGLKSVLQEELRIHFDIGRSVESAPDAVRELHELEVLQPQKQESGIVADTPVEQPKQRKSGFRGASKRIKAELEAEQRRLGQQR